MEVFLDKNEIIRYLGGKNTAVDSNWDNLINFYMEEIKKDAKPLYIFKEFSVADIDGGIIIGGNTEIISNSIKMHLKDSSKCAILCATLGSSVDKKIRLLQKVSMSEALIYDACANDYIEKVCEQCQIEIETLAFEQQKFINYRFSAGYDDFPIKYQGRLLTLLDAGKRIGLNISESNLLTPQKSVTAIIGYFTKDKILQRENSTCKNKCSECNLKNTCNFKKEKINEHN